MTDLSGYVPTDDEAEAASNAYLMSMMAMAVGILLPIINLVATAIFFVQQRRGTHFVRWHATQALLSQLSMVPVNSALIWWSVSIAFGPRTVTNAYLAYVLTAVLANGAETAGTIRSAVRTRRGEHVSWRFFGPLTDLLCRS